MLRSRLQSLFESAASVLSADRSALPPIEIAEPRDPEHGDFACNFALAASKALGKPPRDVATALVAAISKNDLIASTEIAGPGFINIRLKPEAIASQVAKILALGPSGLASSNSSSASKSNINLEFVSVNPNGPITVGSGRGAAFGSTLGNVLEASGHKVHREYYVNDGTNSEQMRLFAESVRELAFDRPVPENGYKGDYVQEVAEVLRARAPGATANNAASLVAESVIWLGYPKYDISLPPFPENFYPLIGGPGWSSGLGEEDSAAIREIDKEQVLEWFANSVELELKSAFPAGPSPNLNSQLVQGKRGEYGQLRVENALEISTQWFRHASEGLMLTAQKRDLKSFGVQFDTWFSEQSLHDLGVVTHCVDELIANGTADENPIRTKVKFAKGGAIEDVEIEAQTSEFNEDGETESVSASELAHCQTLWLRSTKFGDDMDRVLRRKDGRLTYIASDVAYHKDKFKRGSKPDTVGKVEPADKLITVLGPDHHGYIGRLHAVVGALLEEPESSGIQTAEPLSELEAKIYKSAAERDACLAALAESREKLEVVIFQIVRFVKDGKPAPMRKRDGNIYSLRDLMAEIGRTAAPNDPEEEQMRIGKDVARFFYLMRSHDTHMDFDIDLATKQSDENPVFYCQYAHARICSVIRKAEEAGFSASTDGAHSMLHDPRELTLIKKILELPHEVQRCAEDYGVHRLTTYAVELARTYHAFYDDCRVIQPDQPELTQARLALCEATKIGLQAVFNLLGVSAPERMDREQVA